ncbi:MAG: phage baseplate assembly protein V [Phenylobacterium sp.]|nr:phage baseplate assembly protein V [Phenylobacterium sp.]
MSEDLSRRVGDLVRIGRVVEVAGKRARVAVAGAETGLIKFGALRAGRLKVWARPQVGEQVMLFTPDGDLERAIGGPAVPMADFPDAGDAVDFIEFEDGGRISYDHDAQLLAITLAGGGRAEIWAPGGLVIKGDVRVDGDLVARGVSLPGHTHPDTGPPVGGSA